MYLLSSFVLDVLSLFDHFFDYFLHLLDIMISNALVLRVEQLLVQLLFKESADFIGRFLRKEIHSTGKGAFVGKHSRYFSLVNHLGFLYIG